MLKEKNTKHTEVLNWISDVNPQTSYQDIRERTGVADRYKDCGEWLLETPEFRYWSSTTVAEFDMVLWLRGTGK